MESDEIVDGGFRTASLTITPAFLAIIARIDEFKGAWRSLGQLAPERLTRLRRVATIESIGSSTRIEGASLSDREIERLLSPLEITPFETRDEQEVAGYAEVIETVWSHAEDLELSENHIRQLHGDLLRHSGKDSRHRGHYKSLPNHLEAFDSAGKSLGVVFETASPFDTPRLMTELVDWTCIALEDGDLHPLLVIGIFVVVFLEIHPFQDGNGRLSRVLTNLLLLRSGYGYVPYSSLESVVESSKDEYYAALRATQPTLRSSSPDWQPWIGYFLRSLKAQKDSLEEKLRRERIIADLPQLSARILEIAGDHGRVTVGELARLLGVSRNTIKDHVRALTRSGRLQRNGAGRGTWYAPS